MGNGGGSSAPSTTSLVAVAGNWFPGRMDLLDFIF